MEPNSVNARNRPLRNDKPKKLRPRLSVSSPYRSRLKPNSGHNRNSLNKLNRLTNKNWLFKLNVLPSSMQRRPPNSMP